MSVSAEVTKARADRFPAAVDWASDLSLRLASVDRRAPNDGNARRSMNTNYGANFATNASPPP